MSQNDLVATATYQHFEHFDPIGTILPPPIVGTELPLRETYLFAANVAAADPTSAAATKPPLPLLPNLPLNSVLDWLTANR